MVDRVNLHDKKDPSGTGKVHMLFYDVLIVL